MSVACWAWRELVAPGEGVEAVLRNVEEVGLETGVDLPDPVGDPRATRDAN